MATLEECVKPILIEKADEEILKEMLVISLYGKEFFEKKDEKERESFKKQKLTEQQELLGNLSKETLINQIIKNMNDAITEGLGFFDIFRDMDKYPRQLRECLTIVTKTLKQKAKESNDIEWLMEIEKIERKYQNMNYTFCEVAISLEEDIVILLLDSYIRTLPDKEKEKFFKELEKLLKDLGKNIPTERIIWLITHGGLGLLKTILGFQFHIILTVVINAIWNVTGRVIVGQGITLAVNALIQRMAAIALGPIGLIISALLFVPTFTKLANPREFDKYLPLVVYIYFLRHQDDLGAAIGATVGKPNGPLSGKEARKLKRKPEEEE
jgi:hypothetical protein